MGTEEGDISIATQASFSESNEAPELSAMPESPNNDSGHESTTSTPELPSTPQEERSMTPDKTQVRPSGSSEGTFRIKLVLPNKEAFDIQINGNEMIQEIHQILLERESTCYRTCFRLQFDGLPLDLFTEIRNIPNFHSGDVLQVVEMPYTIREARLHIRHLRELLRSLDTSDAINGTDGNSLSYLPTMMQLTDPKRLRQEAEKKKSAAYNPPEYLLPGSKEPRPMTAYFDVQKDPIVALRSLSLSAFNPPPGPRKMKGDILYLVVETVEGTKFHITCCTKGFYVNSSKDGRFDPRPSNYHNEIYHSLVDLLSLLSNGFKKAYAAILRRRNDKHLFERLPTPYPVHSWMVPYYNHHTEDYIRAEDATQPHKLGIEDAVPGQLRDWNEELQTTRELPRNTEAEAIIRERAMFKVHSDFVAAAVKGAMAVVDGNACPINPADDPRTHMFLWNNIFFSLGFDVKDHYKDVGGDPAAHAAANNDLLAIRAYHNLDTSKLYTLGMVIVDYKGYRVTAQSIIPGILEKDQEQSVVYGSIDFGKTVVGSAEYEELLQKPSEQLRILPHEVYTGKEDGQIVKLYSSFETKGIIGNDSRHYILDLLRTFPPDVNFLEGAEVTEICQRNGFPRKFPHKLVSLRHELIELFLEKRHATFMHAAWTMIHRLRAENISDKEEREKILKILSTAALMDEEKRNELNNAEQIVSKVKQAIKGDVENTELKVLKEATKLDSITDEGAEITRDVAMALLSPEMSQEMLSDASRAVGSISEDVFDVRFNPDCYCTTVKHAETENLKEQRQLVASAAEFLLVYQIPQFIQDCLAHAVLPIDGQGLISALHARGINVRYLGKLVTSLRDIPQLDYVFTITMTELLCRSARHVYRKFIRSSQVENLGAAAAHFLNCLVGYHGAQTFPQPSSEKLENGITETSAPAPVGQTQRKSKNKRKNRNISGQTETKQPEEWTTMTIRSLWKDLTEDSDSHYGYRIEADHCDAFMEISGAQRIAIVRRFCMMNGIQLILKDYNLDSKTKLPFSEDDIHNMYPVVKHMNPHAKDAQNLFLSGQTKVHQGILRMGYDLISESLGLMNNIYGAVHPDMVQCMRLLGRLAYVFSDTSEALNQQHKATLISERCNGLDHTQTIMEYIHMAHFMFANLAIAASLKLLYRARFLLLTVYGENHPIMGQIDANIGVILYTVQDYDSCLKFLNNALRLTLAYNNQICLKTALIYNILAHTYSCRGDFRMAIQMQKETSSIYAKAFGEDNEKTKEASNYLRYLTQEAVSYQKRVNEASRTGSNVGASCLGQVLPYQVQQPTMQTIIETLNMINGIVFIHVKPSNSSSPPPQAGASSEKLAIDEKSSQTTDCKTETITEEQPKLQDEGLD
uniref:Clustered mitochondria protein homolog n=1 Tax=Acrobeloides nanus TaxID=290746 RepID=A0A914DXN8_9BILA